MAITAASVGVRLDDLHSRVEEAGGDWRRITLVAVTKDFGRDAVTAAVQNGLVDLGENRAEDLRRKATMFAAERIRWHYLDRIQRGKVARLAPFVGLWQAVDRLAAGEEIAARAPEAAVLVQVNVSGEPQKHGCAPEDAPELVAALESLALDVRGLMAVGPTGPPEAARPGFRALASLADDLRLPVRSMGMTDDLHVAVQEGTTMLRIGRGLFGERPSTT